MSIQMIALLLYLLIVFNAINCRQLSYVQNPDCDEYNSCKQWTNKTTDKLIDITYKDTKDSIHYLWSSVSSLSPTLLIFKTTHNTTVGINWDSFLDKNKFKPFLNINSEPLFGLGFQFNRLFFFNDISQSGHYIEGDPIAEINWNQFNWSQVVTPKDVKDSMSVISANADNCKIFNGTVSFNLRVRSSDGRNDELPQLTYTESSVSLDLNVIDVDLKNHKNFTGDKYFPRLMASISVVTLNGTKSATKLSKTTTIDDEYTPGVFDRIHLDLDSTKDRKLDQNERQGFIQWKPIAYNNDEKIIANTLDVIASDVQKGNNNSKIDNRLIETFVYNKDFSLFEFNLTFGANDDTSYYDKSKYNSYSLVIGLGSAPEESLSLLVQMIILVGFGLPVLVMIGSSAYLIYRRIKKRKIDNLLLNQSTDNINQ
ncbi:glycosylated lysosomal membrane protein A-like [Oppia nitens]|uniref:glycosylated lysosomal membrane protein A-like n=1 Tax=Oppia nitens TaxID=1686743 RepID=UPI0023DB6AA0|nr:glycosylated lysosomal membrane protein A-like [Oppia nitens]